MKLRKNYGNQILNKAYDKYVNGEYLSYEEFVIMLSTNDELYFMYNEREYQVEHFGSDVVFMCVSKFTGNDIIIERNEKFCSIIELLRDFKVGGRTIYEIWPHVYFRTQKKK